MNLYADLFVTFAKIGSLTFGGGYAMLPILQKEAIEGKQWVTEAEVMDYYAISQCLPGLIAINTAICIGHKIKGWLGGVAAALGVAFPSLAVITVIAACITNFADLPVVQNAFAGIRVCVLVLIVQALFKLRKGALVDAFAVGIFAVVCLLSVLTPLSPVALVLMAAAAGVALSALSRKGGDGT